MRNTVVLTSFAVIHRPDNLPMDNREFTASAAETGALFPS